MLRPRAAAAPLVALALAAAGCPSSDGSCETSAICGDGELCFEGSCVGALPAGAFTPPGTRTITNGGVTTATYSAGCPPTNAAPIATGWEQDLGTFTVGETASFDVPVGTASVTIHIQGVSPAPASVVDFGYEWAPNYVTPTRVQLPGGQTIYESTDAFDLLTGMVTDPSMAGGYMMPSAWTATFTFPLSHRSADFALADGSVPSGTWSVTLSDLQSGCSYFGGCAYAPPVSYRVTVIKKPGPYLSTGRLGLTFYFASSSVSATTASGARIASYQRFVDGIDRLLGQAGVAVDDVTFLDLPAQAVTAFQTTYVGETASADGHAPCDEQSRLFTLADRRFDGVHVFLVDNLTSSLGGVVGLTGSIPGPSGVPGAVTSGIVMSLQDIDLVLRNVYGTATGVCGPAFDLLCDADGMAYVAAHEIGHWLGLFHPTESGGDLFDPLTDTATCSCDACNPDGCLGSGMYPAYCMGSGDACGGGTNLMFWQLVPGFSRGDVTPEQGFVMRANPAVKWVTP